MKKKITMIVCAVCLLALAMGLMVGCGDDTKPSGEKDLIIGTWIGTEQGDGYTRHFYAEIVISTKYENCFVIDAKAVFSSRDSENITNGNVYKNPKVENRYSYNGDFSPLPHKQDGETWRFSYTLDMSSEKMIVAGNEERRNSFGNFMPFSATYTFERTTLTLEQYEEQLKAA